MSSSFAAFLFPLPLFFLLPSSCNLEFPLVHPLISLLLLLLLVFFTIVIHLLLLFLLLLPVPPPVAPYPSLQSFLDSTSPSYASATNPIVVESNRYRPICFYCCLSLLLSHHFNRHSNLSGFTGAMNFSDFNTIGVTAIPLLIIPNITITSNRQLTRSLIMTKVSLIFSIFTFLEVKKCKFSYLPPTFNSSFLAFALAHAIALGTGFSNRRIVSYRLPSSTS